MTRVLDWHTEATEALQHAVQAIMDGQLVVVPTPNGYCVAASGFASEAVGRLSSPDREDWSGSWAVAVRGPAEVRDWVPDIGTLGHRLTKRAWPGPLDVLIHGDTGRGLGSRLPAEVRDRVSREGGMLLRAPHHEAMHAILRNLPGPLVINTAVSVSNPSGTLEDMLRALPVAPAVVVEDTDLGSSQPPTLVRIDGDRVTILQPGEVDEAELSRLTATVLLFVCTGNTCRSPLAEGFCKKLLGDRLGCTADELPSRGYFVLSAGVAAVPGMPAADEAVAVASGHGVDLTRHQSRPLTAQMLAQADGVFAMTRSHLRALVGQFPRVGPAPRLLSPHGLDLPDPIGGDAEVYQECARQILSYLEERVPELDRT